MSAYVRLKMETHAHNPGIQQSNPRAYGPCPTVLISPLDRRRVLIISKSGMTRFPGFVFGATVCALLNTVCNNYGQGSLTPPAGPPAPTMKTLEQIEPRRPISSLPFTILEPGSYYLTGSLTGSVNSTGIMIRSGDVAIDLNGFTLAGVANSLAGIRGAVPVTNVVIHNGIIRGWGQGGVELSSSRSCRFERIQANQNQIVAIWSGSNTIVLDCVLQQNTGGGLQIQGGGTVRNCVANDNGGSELQPLPIQSSKAARPFEMVIAEFLSIGHRPS
jgi:hypothetical protein